MPAPPDQPGRGAWRAVTLCTGVTAAGDRPGEGAVAARRGEGRGFPGREQLVTFAEGAPAAAAGARGGPLPVVRDADPGDTGPVLAVYSACIAGDPGYLPFLVPGDKPSVLAWFRLKPLLACLVAELDGTVVGGRRAAGRRARPGGRGAGRAVAGGVPSGRAPGVPRRRGHAGPGRCAGIARRGAGGGPPVNALRRELALAPAGAVTRLDLVGADRVRGTRRPPAGRPAGPPAARTAGPQARDLSPSRDAPDSTATGKACQPAGTAPAGSLPAGARSARPAGPDR